MPFYLTRNPVPSTDMRDIFDNAQVLDSLINGDASEVTGRTGKELKSIAYLQSVLTSLDVGSFTFADTTTGLAGTTTGQYFRVPQGADSSDSFVYYLNNSGVAEAVASLAGKQYILKYLKQNQVSPSSIPLFVDADNQVPVWLENGKLDAAGLGGTLKNEVSEVPNKYAPVSNEFRASAVPIIYDKEGNVFAWLENGRLDAAGLGDRLKSVILSMVPDAIISPVIYQQRGYRFKLERKLTQIKMGASASVNIAFTGDSWAEMNNIPQAFLNGLGGVYKDAGWIPASVRTDNVMAGITITATGMTTYDADNEHSAAPPLYGCGPDGNGLYTNGVSGSVTFDKIPATDLTLYYFDGTGTLTVTVDGTSQTVSGGNTGLAKAYKISGLSSAELHKVTVATSATGICSVLGMYATNSSVPSGFSVSRMGNGGAVGSDYNNFATNWIYPIAKDFDLDLVIIILGTNDFRKSMGVTEYTNALNLIIQQYRLCAPDASICLVSPAQSNATGTPALVDYDTAMRDVATENNTDFVSGYRLFPAVRDTSISNMWFNDLHLGALGSRILSEEIIKNLQLI